MIDTGSKKYVILTRCSTEEQRKKGASHESQVREIKRHSRLTGFECVKSFHETVSGWKNVERTTLDEVYRFCIQNADVKFLIIQKWDRFYRNSLKALEWIEKFKSINIEVNAAEQWINYQGGSINTILGIYIGMAADESHNISTRVKDRNRVWREKGYWLHDAPYGYFRDRKQLDENGKTKIVKHKDEAYATNLIFELLNKQVLLPHEIRKKVLAEGFDIPSSVFYRMIKNVFYSGHLVLKPYKGEKERIIKSRYPSYITLEQFYKNQAYLENIKTGGGRKVKTNTTDDVSLFTLRGHIKCNKCGGSLTASLSKGKNRKYGYYHHNGCKVRIPTNAADSLINEILKEFELKDEYYDILQVKINEHVETLTSELKNKIAPIKSALSKNEKRFSKLKYLLTDDEISINEYRTIKSEIEKDKLEKENELVRANEQLSQISGNVDAVLKLLNNFHGIYTNLDNQHKRLILNTIFPKGFTVERIKNGNSSSFVCRTPKINDLIDILCCKSASYDKQKTELLEVVPCRTPNDTKIEHQTDVIKMFNEWLPIVNALKIA